MKLNVFNVVKLNNSNDLYVVTDFYRGFVKLMPLFNRDNTELVDSNSMQYATGFVTANESDVSEIVSKDVTFAYLRYTTNNSS